MFHGHTLLAKCTPTSREELQADKLWYSNQRFVLKEGICVDNITYSACETAQEGCVADSWHVQTAATIKFKN